MDLALFIRVVWRFKYIVAGGLLLAILLAVLAMARPSFSGGLPTLKYRKSEVWQSQTSLLLSQPGFPYGRAALANGASAQPGSQSYADAAGLSNLASLYANLASSDAVKSQLGLKPGELLTATAQLNPSNQPLPVVGILGDAATPKEASALSREAASVFRKYIERQQRAAGIPSGQRIILQVISGTKVQLLVGHKKTIPIVAFITVMIATFGLIFVLENLRPEVRTAEEPTVDEDEPAQRLQRSA